MKEKVTHSSGGCWRKGPKSCRRIPSIGTMLCTSRLNTAISESSNCWLTVKTSRTSTLNRNPEKPHFKWPSRRKRKDYPILGKMRPETGNVSASETSEVIHGANFEHDENLSHGPNGDSALLEIESQRNTQLFDKRDLFLYFFVPNLYN